MSPNLAKLIQNRKRTDISTNRNTNRANRHRNTNSLTTDLTITHYSQRIAANKERIAKMLQEIAAHTGYDSESYARYLKGSK